MARKMVFKNFKKDKSWSKSIETSIREAHIKIKKSCYDSKTYEKSFVFWIMVQKELEQLRY